MGRMHTPHFLEILISWPFLNGFCFNMGHFEALWVNFGSRQSFIRYFGQGSLFGNSVIGLPRICSSSTHPPQPSFIDNMFASWFNYRDLSWRVHVELTN